MSFITNDLFGIATSGLRAQQELLQTTSNNIANVNTPGYTRQRTIHGSQLAGGVADGVTQRVMDTFAQNQLRRDTSTYEELTAYYEKASLLDDVFANNDSSLGTTISSFFAALQTAADEPNNMAARSLVLGEADSMNSHMAFLSGYMSNLEEQLNMELNALTNEANSHIEEIANLNKQIRLNQYQDNDDPGTLLDQRDQAILELSELVAINTRDLEDGTTLVNLSTGESLVLQDGTFNVFEVNGDPDNKHKDLTLLNGSRQVGINLGENRVGGRIGGLFEYRDEVLTSTQRQLGQIAISLADAVNQQNRMGMDYDGQLGSDIFNLPELTALNYLSNGDPTAEMKGRIEAGRAGETTTADYRITIDSVDTSGSPSTVDFTVEVLNPDGTNVEDADGNPISQSYTGVEAAAGSWVSVIDGLELEFAEPSLYNSAAGVNDQFLIQPTKYSAEQITLNTSRAEDLALASPIRVESNINNLGDAEVLASSVSNNTVDNTLADSETSAFNGSGGLHGPGAAPGGSVGAPVEVYFTAADSFEIRDSAGTTITTVTGVTSMENLLAQGAATAGWPAAFSALDDYPGYDFSLQGVPQAGDRFTIGFNTDGLDDNRNGLAMADLENQSIMRRNAETAPSETNKLTVHEAFSTIVGEVGEKVSAADIAVKAADAMKTQSEAWYESVSGVSLDEEAANLIRFQQAYAASARLLTTAQSLFDTILSSVR